MVKNVVPKGGGEAKVEPRREKAKARGKEAPP